MKFGFSHFRGFATLLGVCAWLLVEAQTCAGPFLVPNEAGKCGAFVNLPKPCAEAADQSRFFTVGSHQVIFQCNAGRCTTMVTVMDTEGPIFANCSSRTVTLASGECGPTAYELLDPTDNCDAKTALTITPNTGNPYPINHTFLPGNYALSYIVRDRANNPSICSFNLTVVGVPNRTTSVSCYRDLNISLDSSCVGRITPAMVLEGGPYGCLNEYIVNVIDENNNPIGNSVGAQHVGKTLKYEVLTPDNNKCWGFLKVEDKKAPVLECKDIYTSCSADIKPNALLPNTVVYKSVINTANNKISTSNSNNLMFPINVFGLRMGTVTDINVNLKLRHTNVSNLQANLIAPNGTVVTLFNSLGSCTGDDINITLDDEATLPNTGLRDSCLNSEFAKYGVFRPFASLSTVENINPNGTWKIQIIDNVSGNGGLVEVANITFNQVGNRVNFPTSKAITVADLGDYTYKVTGMDNCTATTLTYKDSIANYPCDSVYESVILRTWYAEDAFGNVSAPCIQRIFKVRTDITSVIFPPNYDDNEKPVLSCIDWADTVPGPAVTGKPEGDFCKNIQVFPHEDFKFSGCDKSYKILRRWKVADWCTGEVITHEQIIKVLDKAGPVMNCTKDTIISASHQVCTTNFKPRRPVITKECSNVIRYELSYYSPLEDERLTEESEFTKFGIIGDSVITNLPLGDHYIKWTLRDVCFNESSCIFKVTVKDLVSPVAICRQFTAVSIGASGGAEISASSFDDKSYDNCGIIKYEALKMTDSCPDTIREWREKVKFCCEEVGKSVMVSFRVTDASGNSNICMVEVKVEDKLPPYIICPSDKTIDCTDNYRDTSKLGTPVFGDNCGVDGRPTFKDSVKIDQCGKGLVMRTWSVKDKRGFTASCVQRIFIENRRPFNRDSIIWPIDLDTARCGVNFHPDSLPLINSRPRIKYADCSQVAINYKDQVFRFSAGACEKVLRTWTIIDWCNYNEYNKTGVYEKVQILKLSNKIAPTFNICKDDSVEVFDNCRGRVIQSKFATDDCKPESLKYTWSVDVFADGIAPDTMNGTGTSFDVTLPVGLHRVRWTADDLCGNATTCSYILKVKDGKKPTPYCLSSITTVVMPSSGNIAIWAKDFDYGSSDNCSPKSKLKISFSKDVKDTSRLLTCKDIPNGRTHTLPLQMWVTDEAGNQEYCDVSIVVQDNTGNVCPDNTNPLTQVSGKIIYTDLSPVIDASVRLDEGNIFNIFKSDANGFFQIRDYQAVNNMTVSVDKSTQFAKGLNTLDLVYIQKHILGVDKLKRSEQLIAADFNNDYKISVADILSMRKVILGIEDKMPNDGSPIKFVLTNSMTGNTSSNLKFEETLGIPSSGGNFPNINFTGIRLGDIDESALKGVQSRNSNVVFQTKMMNQTLMCLFTERELTTFGFQMKFELKNGAKITSITSPQIDLSSDYLYISENGMVTIAWHAAYPTQISNQKPIIEISLSDGSKISPELILMGNNFNQWYDEDFKIRTLSIQTGFDNEGGFDLLQNAPNPFSEMTHIGIDMKQNKGNVLFNIFDLLGRQIVNKNLVLTQGMNYISVDKAELPKEGTFIYQFSHNGVVKFGKMIMIQ